MDENEKLEKFVSGVQEAIKEFINIAFERADLLDLIANRSNFQYLNHFNPAAVFDADLNTLQVGKVFSLITDVQSSIDKLVKQGPRVTAKPNAASEGSIDRLEKVRSSIIFEILAQKTPLDYC